MSKFPARRLRLKGCLLLVEQMLKNSCTEYATLKKAGVYRMERKLSTRHQLQRYNSYAEALETKRFFEDGIFDLWVELTGWDINATAVREKLNIKRRR